MSRLEKYMGSLVAGAAGDALGYAVEFINYDTIQKRYGAHGIESYNRREGIAMVSDDTQMMLFTMQGIMISEARKLDILECLYKSYKSWNTVQNSNSVANEKRNDDFGFLYRDRRLWDRRAPGMTCMRSLRSGTMGSIKEPINDSSGSGGIVRVTPIGLYYSVDTGMSENEVVMLGAEAAAITHGHELGYIPSGLLTDILYRIMNETEGTLESIITAANESVCNMFGNTENAVALRNLVNQAILLAKAKGNAVEDICKLGEGWVADEAIAIAIYAALRCDSIEESLIVAVNHDGAGDSTGAVCGSIVGAWYGIKQIPEKFVLGLELFDLMEDFAYDMDERDFKCEGIVEKYKP